MQVFATVTTPSSNHYINSYIDVGEAFVPVIPALGQSGRWRQGDQSLKVLGCTRSSRPVYAMRPCLRKLNQIKPNKDNPPHYHQNKNKRLNQACQSALIYPLPISVYQSSVKGLLNSQKMMNYRQRWRKEARCYSSVKASGAAGKVCGWERLRGATDPVLPEGQLFRGD